MASPVFSRWSTSDNSLGFFHLAYARLLPIQGTVKNRKLFLAQGSGIPSESDTQYFCFDINDLEYVAFCDDFGPMNASCVIKFIQIVHTHMKRHPDQDLVCCVQPGRRNLTNAAFLAGAWAVLLFGESPDELWERYYRSIRESTFEPFRDATFAESDFGLTLLDCWKALARAKTLGWIDRPGPSGIWGKIIPEEYSHYEDPLNGDLHIVVPDKFVAFKGPKDLAGGRAYLDAHGTRDFSASYYVDIFKELGVKAVVRLNEQRYNAAAFETHEISHHDLEFEDCTTPPDHIVAEFFRIVDATDGKVAVHCKAGLGRTGTLIALHMMRAYRFPAREAVGWLRIMRPGSVIGDQQSYLCEVERAVQATVGGERHRDVGGEAVSHSQRVYGTVAPADIDYSSRRGHIGQKEAENGMCGGTAADPAACGGRDVAGGGGGGGGGVGGDDVEGGPGRRRSGAARGAEGGAAGGAAVLARQVAEGMERRAAELIRRGGE